MPEITFCNPARLSPGYEEFTTYEEWRGSQNITLGNWPFRLKNIKPLYDGFTLIGYEETYENSSISQEETDRLMQKFREETGQTRKE